VDYTERNTVESSELAWFFRHSPVKENIIVGGWGWRRANPKKREDKNRVLAGIGVLPSLKGNGGVMYYDTVLYTVQ
jgi:hypothetical protein